MNLATTSATAPLLLSNLTAGTSTTNVLTLVPNITTGGTLIGPPLPPPVVSVVPPPIEAETEGSDGGEEGDDSGGPPPPPPEMEEVREDEPIALPYMYDPEPPPIEVAPPPPEEGGEIPEPLIIEGPEPAPVGEAQRPPETKAEAVYYDPPPPPEEGFAILEPELIPVTAPTPEPEIANMYFDPEFMGLAVATTATAAPTPMESPEAYFMYFDPEPPTTAPATTADVPDIGGFYFDPESSTASPPEGDDGGGDGNSSLPESPYINTGFYFDPNPTNDSTTVGQSFGFLPDPEPEGPPEEYPPGGDGDESGSDPRPPPAYYDPPARDEDVVKEPEEDNYLFDREPGELNPTGGGGGGGGPYEQNTTNVTTTTNGGPIEIAEDYYDPDPPIEASRLQQQPTSLSAYYSKHRTLAIIPHITGAMSMLGSGWIILDIARDRKKHGKVYHRLMLSMSVFDFLSSFWLMLSTIPVPAGSTFIYGARGTTATCTAQGFFLQLNIATPLYNMYLAIYYLLLIGYQWCEGRIKRQVEPKMHIAALVFALGTAVAGIGLKLYNPTLWCHIAAHPMNCSQSYRNGGVSDCIRGDNASVYMFAFYYGVLWFAILVATVSLFLVYWKVLSLERRTAKYKFHGSANNSKPPAKRKDTRKKSLTVANLSLLYMLAFYLTWIFPTIAAIMYSKDGGESFIVSLLAVIFLPLQGFFNMLIYIRPRYQQYRKKYSESSVFRVLGRVVRRTVSFWNSSDEDDGDHELGTGVDSSSQSQSQSQPAGSDSGEDASSDTDEGEKVNELRPESGGDSFNEKVESENDSSYDEREAHVQVQIS